jgi:hypothetical protein
MFSTTFAAAGTGKLLSFALTEIVRPGMGAPVDGGAERTTAWLGVAVLVPDELADGVPVELADGVPAEHAATDRLAAQAAKASAAERYLFIGFLQSVHKPQVPTLNARPAS